MERNHLATAVKWVRFLRYLTIVLALLLLGGKQLYNMKTDDLKKAEQQVVDLLAQRANFVEQVTEMEAEKVRMANDLLQQQKEIEELASELNRLSNQLDEQEILLEYLRSRVQHHPRTVESAGPYYAVPTSSLGPTPTASPTTTEVGSQGLVPTIRPAQSPVDQVLERTLKAVRAPSSP